MSKSSAWKSTTSKPTDEQVKIRLDKWLWAARFFKTRNLAKAAVEGGKVQYNGLRSKPSRSVEVGAQVLIRQGFDHKEVVIKALSDQRRGAPEAQTLYQETPQSQQKRLAQQAQRRSLKGAQPTFESRPNKRQRRQLRELKEVFGDGFFDESADD